MSQYSHLSERDSGLPLDIPGLFVGPITSDPVPRLRQKYVLDLPEKLELHRPHLPPGIFFMLQLQKKDIVCILDSKYTVENHTIAVEDGEICVRTISPMPTKDESPNFPVLVYFHGGGVFLTIILSRVRNFICPGWVVGDLDMKDFALRILSVELRFTIVNVDYRCISRLIPLPMYLIFWKSIRLAPEHPFPTGLDDCYAALKWVGCLPQQSTAHIDHFSLTFLDRRKLHEIQWIA
jgi:acetyl esterase/lipase